jgi:quercetin dioxygenase-like cupin family protein
MKVDNNSKSQIEVQKGTSHIIIDIVDYMPNSVTDKSIMKKSTGNIRAVSFDLGQELKKRTFPFDTFIQVIEGNAEVKINNISHKLYIGHGIVIPAHATSAIRSDGRFKIIETIIKSGYE